MKKQKICVIGGGITGLTVATVLARSNLCVDLVDENFYKNSKTIRTTAISDSNYDFLKKLNISKSESIMVGDSITDLKSGHSAGMPVVLVEYGYTENTKIYGEADLVINNFSQLKELI